MKSSVCRGGEVMFCRRRKPAAGTSSGSVVIAVYLRLSQRIHRVSSLQKSLPHLVVFCSSTPLIGRNCASRVGMFISMAKKPFSSRVADCLILRYPAALCARRPTRPAGAGPKCLVVDISAFSSNIPPCSHEGGRPPNDWGTERSPS